MKLVITVSHADMSLAAKLVTRLKEIGGFENRFILLVSTWKDSWDAKPIADYVATFAPSFHYITDDPEVDKWPEAPAHLFVRSAEWLDEQENQDPWFLFEPDCAPLRPDFMAAFEREYAEAGKPYMGVKNRAIIKRISTGEFFPGEEHMVGAGIYPANFWSTCERIHHTNDWPFDTYIGEEVVPQMHITDLIAHRWSTQKWELGEDGNLHGQLTERARELNAPDPPPIITPAHAVVHGSKDDSIFKVAMFPAAS